MPIDQANTGDPLARIDRMFEHYRLARMRRLRRRALIVWRKLEARQAFDEFEKRPALVH